jgi:uncharacterized protein YvpB
MDSLVASVRRHRLRAVAALLAVVAMVLGPVSAVRAGSSTTATAPQTSTTNVPQLDTGGNTTLSSALLNTAAAPLHSNSISVPSVTQQYSLDCEAAALQAALAARGTNVSQDWILSVIGADTTPAVIDSSGSVVAWGDPYKTFVGNVNGSEVTGTGYGVYYGPIAKAARAAGHVAVGGTGWSATDIYYALSQGYPVVVWTDTTYSAVPTSTWTAWDGRSVPHAVGEHAVTLTGVDVVNNTVKLLDVETGQFLTFSMAQFTSFWSTFGNMAVVVG